MMRRWCYQIENVIGSPIERRRLNGFDYGVFQPELRPAKKTVYSTPKGRRSKRRSPRYNKRSGA